MLFLFISDPYKLLLLMVKKKSAFFVFFINVLYFSCYTSQGVFVLCSQVTKDLKNQNVFLGGNVNLGCEGTVTDRARNLQLVTLTREPVCR